MCIIELYVFMMHIFKCDFPNIKTVIMVLIGSFTYRIYVSVLNNLKNLLFLKVIALLKVSHLKVCWYSIFHLVFTPFVIIFVIIFTHIYSILMFMIISKSYIAFKRIEGKIFFSDTQTPILYISV